MIPALEVCGDCETPVRSLAGKQAHQAQTSAQLWRGTSQPVIVPVSWLSWTPESTTTTPIWRRISGRLQLPLLLPLGGTASPALRALTALMRSTIHVIRLTTTTTAHIARVPLAAWATTELAWLVSTGWQALWALNSLTRPAVARPPTLSMP